MYSLIWLYIWLKYNISIRKINKGKKANFNKRPILCFFYMRSTLYTTFYFFHFTEAAETWIHFSIPEPNMFFLHSRHARMWDSSVSLPKYAVEWFSESPALLLVRSALWHGTNTNHHSTCIHIDILFSSSIHCFNRSRRKKGKPKTNWLKWFLEANKQNSD